MFPLPKALLYLRQQSEAHGGAMHEPVIGTMTWNNPDFAMTPAAAGHHHVYEGGLAIHTAEVVFYADLISGDSLAWEDKQALILAAILHDALKVRDYEFCGDKANPQWRKTPYASQIHHIAGSVAMFTELLGRAQLYPSQYLVETIMHNMLAHHGCREYGSPVVPQTAGAYILHAADNLSCRMGKVRSAAETSQCALWAASE